MPLQRFPWSKSKSANEVMLAVYMSLVRTVNVILLGRLGEHFPQLAVFGGVPLHLRVLSVQRTPDNNKILVSENTQTYRRGIHEITSGKRQTNKDGEMGIRLGRHLDTTEVGVVWVSSANLAGSSVDTSEPTEDSAPNAVLWIVKRAVAHPKLEMRLRSMKFESIKSSRMTSSI